MSSIELLPPALELLSGYETALAAGWSPDTGRDISKEQLAMLLHDRVAFIGTLTDQNRKVVLPDGSRAPRLPFRLFWIWDGEFCGQINLRWVQGSEELPSYVSGHVGYAVVPWKRRRGYATEALRLLLPIAQGIGMARVMVTCDDDNLLSRRVIERNGGIFAGTAPDLFKPSGTKLLFWVSTTDSD